MRKKSFVDFDIQLKADIPCKISNIEEWKASADEHCQEIINNTDLLQLGIKTLSALLFFADNNEIVEGCKYFVKSSNNVFDCMQANEEQLQAMIKLL